MHQRGFGAAVIEFTAFFLQGLNGKTVDSNIHVFPFSSFLFQQNVDLGWLLVLRLHPSLWYVLFLSLVSHFVN